MKSQYKLSDNEILNILRQQINNIRIIIQQQSSPNPNPPHPLFSGIV